MKKVRPIQYFTYEYLQQCKLLTHEQILNFLEDFRTLYYQHYFSDRGVKNALISKSDNSDSIKAYNTLKE